MMPFSDLFLWFSLGGLITTSLFLIGSTAPALLPPQAMYFGIGMVLCIAFSRVPLFVWKKFSWILYVLSLVFLGLVLFSPHVRGATRWVDIGGIQLQPSELLKPFVILIVSYFVTLRKPTKLKHIVYLVGLFIPILFLIFKQPDLGNVLVYIAFFVSILVCSGLPWKYLLLSVLGFILLLPLFWFSLKPYQRDRMVSFINPYADPVGAGYNALQAMIAVGSGQLYGLGLGRGTQSRLAFLPEYHTDFVYASLGEELGFVGAGAILVFYATFFIRLLRRASQQYDLFERYVVIGVFGQLFIQVFINVGMNIGLLPITGITLPLVSYGGSSILSTFMDLGLVLAATSSMKSPLVIR